MAVYCTPADVAEITGQQYRDCMVKLSNIVGAFAAGDVVTGGTSGTVGTVSAIDLPFIQVLLKFPEFDLYGQGEPLAAAPSGATATCVRAIQQTKPGFTAAQSLCARISAEFEQWLKVHGVALPLPADPALMAMVKNGVCYGVAAAIEAQLYLQQPQNESQRQGMFSRKYDAFLLELKGRPEIFGGSTGIAFSFPDPNAPNSDPYHFTDGSQF